MKFRSILVVVFAVVAAFYGTAALLGRATSAETTAAQFASSDTTAYTLPPGKLAKATALHRSQMVLAVAGTAWSLVELLLLLASGVAARLRDFVVRLSGNVWLQGYAFVFGILLLILILDLPLNLYGHRVSLSYGLSVQGWGSWLGDKGKVLLLEWVIGTPLVMLITLFLRKSPTRWWLWFWGPAAAWVIVGVFITPYVIDPLFNKFEPLNASNPALVQQLERVVQRGGLVIPPERMFLMKASEKSTQLNAYVTGFWSSKRVVVWDTTIAKSAPEDISFIFAHEMGHYALGHVLLGTALQCVGLLPFFWLGYRGVEGLLTRYGQAWRIPSQQDWGALVVLALVLSTLSTFADPIVNAISRAMEHNADVYGQEAVHGLIADPQTVGRNTFQLLGETSLNDPKPHPFYELWFYTHPSIRFRAAFSQAYDPWVADAHPKYFEKQGRGEEDPGP